MPTRPNPSPAPYLGVEIDCTWPSGAWSPGAQPPDVDAAYEAYPRAHHRVAADTLPEIRRLIRAALAD